MDRLIPCFTLSLLLLLCVAACGSSVTETAATDAGDAASTDTASTDTAAPPADTGPSDTGTAPADAKSDAPADVPKEASVGDASAFCEFPCKERVAKAKASAWCEPMLGEGPPTGFVACIDYCKAHEGAWSDKDRKAFTLCVTSDPLCFQTIEACMKGP